MKSPQSRGMNRSGIDLAPQGAEEMRKAVQEFPPSSEGSQHTLAQLRAPYVAEADPIGSIPLPGTFKGAAKAGMQKLLGSTNRQTGRAFSLRKNRHALV